MKNTILGAAAGLFLGSIGAFAYSHYVDGNAIDDLQSKLDEANSDLTNLKNQHIKLARQTSGESSAAEDLAAVNADLRKQLDAAKDGAPAAPAAPEVNLQTLAGMMMGMMRGGGGPMQAQQRLFTMQARLHLTPDQEAKIKAAMAADQQARRQQMMQRFGRNGGRGPGGPGGGGPGGAGPGGGGGNNGGGNVAGGTPGTPPATDNLDKTLASVLTYQQQADYQKLQADEKSAQAETSATSQVNGVMPLLQLTDSQKEAAMQALYQVQMGAPNPESLMTNPNPMAAIAAQAQATQAVLSKVLTPDQQALYQQESQATAQAMAQFQQGQGQGGRRGRNGQGGANGAGGATAAVPAAADGTTNAASAIAPNGTTNAASATAPDGTTNAAAATAPATDPNATSSTTVAGTAASTNAAPTQ